MGPKSSEGSIEYTPESNEVYTSDNFNSSSSNSSSSSSHGMDSVIDSTSSDLADNLSS